MHSAFFKNISKHIHLTDGEIKLISDFLQEKTVVKNEVLLRQESICQYLYFVEEGCLRIYSHLSSGEEVNVLFSPENWWASDLHSFTTGKKSDFGIDALEAAN